MHGIERRQRIDEAGGEPAEAAVPEARSSPGEQRSKSRPSSVTHSLTCRDPEIDEIVSQCGPSGIGGQIRDRARGVLVYTRRC